MSGRTIRIEACEAWEVEPMECAACGSDATPAEVPMCRTCGAWWYESAEYKAATATENALRAAFTAKLKAQKIASKPTTPPATSDDAREA